MSTFTVRPEGIIRQPALTMPGNATGSEAACTSLNASSIRTLLSLSTVSDVTFDIVRATTSVQTPLVNNASAALTLGNGTYGVTVPGAMGVGGAAVSGCQLSVTGGSVNTVETRLVNTSQDGLKYCSFHMGGATGYGVPSWINALAIEPTGSGGLTFSAFDENAPIRFTNKSSRTERMRVAGSTGNVLIGTSTDDGTSKLQVAGAATFSGAITTGGTVAVTGGITASGVVSHGAYTVATLPAAGSNAGKMAQVTDSNVAASGNYGATVAAGGANRVKVFSDGTNWVIA